MNYHVLRICDKLRVTALFCALSAPAVCQLPKDTTAPLAEEKSNSETVRELPGRILPGVQVSSGTGELVQLPNQWSLRPAGKSIPLGDFPAAMSTSPDRRWGAVLH